MSLILDALRKSEAERKRGQAPSLFSPMPLPSSRRRRAPVWPMLVGVAVLIVVAVVAMRYWPDNAGSESVAEPTVLAPAAQVPATVTAAPPPNLPAPAPAPAKSAPLPPPSAAAVAPPTSAPAPVAVAAAPTPPPPVPVAPEPVADYLPGLGSLPPDQRANLPPLKLSMHVWSEQPARRIAIIDGQRVGEGSSLSGAIVAEIRRDGVALDINGQRYLLPRP